MQNVNVKLVDVVDHGVSHDKDFGAVSVCVEVNVDGCRFSLTYHAKDNASYEATSVVGLDSASDDDKESLRAMFDFVDDDGDKISGEYSPEYEATEGLARALAQRAFDDFFEVNF